MAAKTLLESLTLQEYEDAKKLPVERCKIFARQANLNIDFTDNPLPGKTLIHALHHAGCTAKEYKETLEEVLNIKMINTYYEPVSKVAILIANDRYTHLSKLATPTMDCDTIGEQLKNLNFVVVTIKNSRSTDLRSILEKVISVVPENSYFFIFYAGHGCEMCNTKFILGVDCPPSDVSEDHCITENFVLNQVAMVKPELVILVMDMCRIPLDRTSNPGLIQTILAVPAIIPEHKILITSYSTQPSSLAYEHAMILFDSTVEITSETYQLQSGDTDRVTPIHSQYVNALFTRLTDACDISTLIDRVHADVEQNLTKKQVPIKMQWGTAKRSLYDPATGDQSALLVDLKTSCQDYKDYCSVFIK